jgi:hypothetical protein
MSSAIYSGRLFYESTRIHAAAVYCSDGRLGEHFDDFLQNGLRLPRYDRLALPGGPAVLLASGSAHPEAGTPWDALRFLVEVHGLERIVLIAHQGCAYYLQQLGLSPEQAELRQRADLAAAAGRVHEFVSQLQVDLFFARMTENRIIFEAAGPDARLA